MPADQAFQERLQRIESGRTWVPDGVIVEERRKRRHVSVNARQNRVSIALSLVLGLGMVWVFSQVQPELYGQLTVGDFSAVTGMLESLPLPGSITDA